MRRFACDVGPAGLARSARALAAATPPPTLGAEIISPASGSAQPTQTIELGVFGLTNNSATAPVAVNSVTLKFSNPGLFSSTTLSAVGASPSTAAPPAAINVYNFVIRPVIQPGQELAFSLIVTLANTSSRNETGGVVYAGVGFGRGVAGERNPFWIAFGAIGLAMLGLPRGTRRRVWLAATLTLLLAAGAPGCGSTGGGGSDQPTDSSAQSVTAVAAFALTSGGIDGPPVTTITGYQSVWDRLRETDRYARRRFGPIQFQGGEALAQKSGLGPT